MNKFTIYRQQIYTLLENFGCAKTTSQRDNGQLTTDNGRGRQPSCCLVVLLSLSLRSVSEAKTLHFEDN